MEHWALASIWRRKKNNEKTTIILFITGIFTNLRTMDSIKTIISSCTAALAGITSKNLTPAQLDSSIATLRSFNVNETIDDYWQALPEKPEKEQDIPAWENDNHALGKALNHDLKLFNDELTRVKTIQAALNIPQLDHLIHAAQEVIRPLYNFSAQLSA